MTHAKDIRVLRSSVDKLLNKHRWAEARALVKRRLSSLPDSDRRAKGAMLEVLSWIEMQANRPVAALKVLFECRSLRSRGSPKALDDTLLISRLLMTTGEWSAAYAELANLLGRADAAGWDGLLTALDLCVEAEEKCSAKMQATLDVRSCSPKLWSTNRAPIERC